MTKMRFTGQNKNKNKIKILLELDRDFRICFVRNFSKKIGNTNENTPQRRELRGYKGLNTNSKCDEQSQNQENEWDSFVITLNANNKKTVCFCFL